MNATKMKSQKILAMAIVAMFAACAFSVCLTADSDAENNDGETYYINARVGDDFAYTPTANLTGTTFSMNTFSIGGLSWDSASHTLKTATGGFTTKTADSGVSTTINASWTATEDPSVTQSATQNIVFTVVNKIHFSNSDATSKGIGILSQNNNTSTILDQVTITDSPDQTAWDSVTFDAGQQYFNVDSSTKTLTVKPAQADIPAGTYTMTATAKYSYIPNTSVAHPGNTVSDTKTYTLTIVVAENVEIVAQNLYAFYGENSGSKNFTFTVNNKGDSASFTITPTLDTTTATAGFATASATAGNDIQITVDTDNSALNPGSAEYVVKDITVTATGSKTQGGYTNTYTTSASFKLKVYADLVFTTAPSITGTTGAFVSSSDPNTVLITNHITGATKIVYNWGDGTVTEKKGTVAGSAYYPESHTYTKAGTYTISITAYNDFGNKATYIMYQTEGMDDAEGTPSTETGDDQKGFFDEHGYQFIIFAILAILTIVAFFYFGIQNPLVIILAVIFAILAVCTYAYCDIAGVIDQLQGLFDKN